MKRYLPLTLILILLGSLSVSPAAFATATAPVGPTPTSPLLGVQRPEPEEAEEAEGEEEEFGNEECEAPAEEFEFEAGEEEFEEEEFEFEAEECGEEEATKKGAGTAFVAAPEACQVRRAESSITTLPASDRVLLTVRYLTYSPGTVTVGLKLKDHNGTAAIEHITKHLGAKGVLHLTSKVSAAVMERVAKADEFDISLRAPNTPGYCGGLLEQHLKTDHAVGKARASTVRSGK